MTLLLKYRKWRAYKSIDSNSAEDGRLSIHNYIVDETSNIISVGESNNREKGRVIIERPNFIFDIGKEIENDQLHSIDHFLKNPNNAKFFK